jgi:hypothetical protein
VALDSGGELRCTLGNGSSFQVLLQLRWGEDEVSQLWIGEEWHEERPSPSMVVVAASSHDSVAVAGSPDIELGQEDSERGKMPWGELTMKNEACGRKNWMMAAWGGGGGPVRGGATRRDMRGGGPVLNLLDVLSPFLLLAGWALMSRVGASMSMVTLLSVVIALPISSVLGASIGKMANLSIIETCCGRFS